MTQKMPITKNILLFLIAFIFTIAFLFVMLMLEVNTKIASFLSSLFFTLTSLLLLYRARLNKSNKENLLLKKQITKLNDTFNKQQKSSIKSTQKIEVLHNNILLSKQHLESTFDAISDSICVLDKNFNILRVNESYSKLVKLPIRNILGQKCYKVFFNSDKPCKNCPTIETFETGKTHIRKEMTKEIKDRRFFYEIKSSPVNDDYGKPVNVIESIHDITEERNINMQLIRSEKLATIGIMTAGIAHEMNNPLSGISGNLSNMLNLPEKYGINEKGIARLKSMLEASTRATKIMRGLLDLSHPVEKQIIYADINDIITGAIEKIHFPGYRNIEKDITTADIPPIRCDPTNIEQVILNILTNAFYAIEEKIEGLKKELGKDDIDYVGKIKIQIKKHGNNALVIIEDNGTGIPEKIAKHLFDPFFTTRSPGKGTGLGLSICNKIILEHGGRIWNEEKSGGSKFLIELPFKRMDL